MRSAIKGKTTMKEMESVDIVMKRRISLLWKENVSNASSKDAKYAKLLKHAQHVMLVIVF